MIRMPAKVFLVQMELFESASSINLVLSDARQKNYPPFYFILRYFQRKVIDYEAKNPRIHPTQTQSFAIDYSRRLATFN